MIDQTEITIPQDPTSEKALLSCLIQNPSLISEVPIQVFWIASHRIIYEALERLAKNPSVKELNFPLLKHQLSHQGQLEDAGGAEALNEIWDFCPAPSAWAYYLDNLDVVRRHREAVLGAHEIQRATSSDAALQALDSLLKGAQFVAGSMRHISEVLKSLPDYLEDRLVKKTAVVRFGIKALDDLLWIVKGNQVVISSETGGGKTALACQAVAASAGLRWAFYSLEMDSDAIVARLVANAGSVNLARLYRGMLLPTEFGYLKDTADDFKQRAIWIDDRQVTVSQIANICRSLQRSNGLDAIVVDYLQLVTPSVRGKENRQEQVSEISRSLKNLAMELKIVVITMSQLNDEGRLRESRAIGQDADVVLRISEDQISIDKHRNGPRASVPIRFIGEYTRFEGEK